MKLVSNKGSITAPLLIISAAFIVVIYGLVFLLTNQFNTVQRQSAFDQSLYVAEAGIQYYRWHLAHSPNDFWDGNGEGSEGPYEHIYKDNQGKEVGVFSLQIASPENGSSIVEITSTAWTNQNPEIKRTITASYGAPSLTKYSFLSNASSWYGQGITVHGQIHSNNGIRMDGINTSIVSSSQETYQCGSETGCSPTQSMPGVWGSGPNSSLWVFPQPPIDFDAVFFDLANMRDNAIDSGLYLDDSEASGYHLVFRSDGTVDVYTVTETYSHHGYAVYEGCRRLNHRIRTEILLDTYSVEDNLIIFIEDDIWVDGVINGKVTVAAAEFPLQSNNTNIIINDNLIYLAKDDNHALGLIAHNDIILGRDIPNDFEIDGALMAQNGKVLRHGFFWWCGATSNAVRDSLTIYGSILSNQKSYWNFGSGPTSGFRTREITYDANLLYEPPPYFPTDGEYEFISWEE
jgi:hypothetical protein